MAAYNTVDIFKNEVDTAVNNALGLSKKGIQHAVIYNYRGVRPKIT